MKNENTTGKCTCNFSPISVQDSALDHVTIYASRSGSDYLFLYLVMKKYENSYFIE